MSHAMTTATYSDNLSCFEFGTGNPRQVIQAPIS